VKNSPAESGGVPPESVGEDKDLLFKFAGAAGAAGLYTGLASLAFWRFPRLADRARTPFGGMISRY